MKNKLIKSVLALSTCVLLIINTGYPAILYASEANGQDQVIPVTDISVFPESLILEIGQIHMISASVEPANATDKTVTWRSFDEDIATVDSEGVVTAVNYGITVIEASAGERHYDYCIIRVDDAANTRHKISGRLYSGVNGSLVTYANVTLTDKDGNKSRDYVSILGEFEFNVKNGTYTLEIYEINQGYYKKEITVNGNDIELGDILLDGYYIRGFITSQSRPLEGVLVYTYVNKDELRWCITDETGFYYMDRLTGNLWYNIEITDPNYVPSPVKEYIFSGRQNNMLLNKADPLTFTVNKKYKDDLTGMALTKLTVSDIFTNPDYLNVNLDSLYSRNSEDKSGNGNAYIWDGHGNLPVMRSNGARWADLYNALGLGEWKAAVSSRDEASGFSGTAFYNEDLENIVIAYAAVDNTQQDTSNADLTEHYSRLFAKALEFYNEVINLKEMEGYKISFLTGYGLGGSLAEYVSLCNGTDAITFNTQELASVLPDDILLPKKDTSDKDDTIRRRHVNYHSDSYNNVKDSKKKAAESIIPATARECFGHDIQVAATIIGSYKYTSCDNTDWAMQMESIMTVEDGQFSLTAEYDDAAE